MTMFAASYSTLITDAFQFPVADPMRMLALAVLLRWKEDVQLGKADLELGEEWLEMAEIPRGCVLT